MDNYRGGFVDSGYGELRIRTGPLAQGHSTASTPLGTVEVSSQPEAEEIKMGRELAGKLTKTVQG